MANNSSLGPIQLADASLSALNDALGQLVDRIDSIKGLRGRAQIFDRVAVSNPQQASDAVNLGSTSTDQGFQVTAPLRVVDAAGHLIHSFGAIA